MSATDVEVTDWYRGKELGFDWTSYHFPHWIPVLAPLRTRRLKVLEIGAYEGRSALFFLNYFPHATVTCIDVWDPSVIDPQVVDRMPEDMTLIADRLVNAEGRFDRNVAPFGERVTKFAAWSHEALAELGVQGALFDVIYVDGDHTAVGAYRDCVLAWAMMAAGGIMIIDDYGFLPDLPPDHRPQPGVDAFLKTIRGRFDELHRDYQLIIRARRVDLI